VTFDLILVGGGLANALIAYRVHTLHPELELLLVESDKHLGGNHTWCFHHGDLSESQHQWIQPFVEHHWPYYDVKFPGLERRIQGGYYSFTGTRLDAVLQGALGERALVASPVTAVERNAVKLADGRKFDCAAVIDARGMTNSARFSLAYQKFLGWSVLLQEPHGLEGPLLMDATVEQRDGYRFVYVLPLDERSALIEDTRYSDTPFLAKDAMRSAIGNYAQTRGWQVDEVRREEHGVLPIVLSGDIHGFWDDALPGVARAGLSAALFHPTTGYSLPNAVRLADALGQNPVLDPDTLHEQVRHRSIRLWKETSFFRLLNRMLFRAAEPEKRYRVLERFYGLPEPLISRFYAGTLAVGDRLRLVSGVPPVPILRALRCLPGDKRPASNQVESKLAEHSHET
jgi:lycopene beta-cyclase